MHIPSLPWLLSICCLRLRFSHESSMFAIFWNCSTFINRTYINKKKICPKMCFEGAPSFPSRWLCLCYDFLVLCPLLYSHFWFSCSFSLFLVFSQNLLYFSCVTTYRSCFFYLPNYILFFFFFICYSNLHRLYRFVPFLIAPSIFLYFVPLFVSVVLPLKGRLFFLSFNCFPAFLFSLSVFSHTFPYFSALY